MPVSFFINAHKILVAPVVVGMMVYYDNWSAEAFLYVSLHGTYTTLWLLKHALFPDRRFAERQPFGIGLVFVFLPLAGYYVAPWMLISRGVTLAPHILGLAVSVYILGIFLHFVSDAQKHILLQHRAGLIRTGLFRRTRNPNYLGEVMIYSAYVLLSWHWVPAVILGGWVFGLFVRNMLKKDRSLSRYEGFSDYKKSSGLILPKIL